MFGCFQATAISILALPCFSLASISRARSPSGKTAMFSSPMDSESEPERIPSAMRFRTSAASPGVAAPSNSNELRLLMGLLSSRCWEWRCSGGRDLDQRPARPAQLDGDRIGALLLLHLDLEQQELRRGQSGRMLAPVHGQLARQHAARD